MELDEGKGGLEMFSNRLRKNKKEVAKKAKQNSVTCYRVYDKDVPQVPVAVDCYMEDSEDIEPQSKSYYVLQYFRGPYDIGEDESSARMDRRITAIRDIILDVFQIERNQLFIKLREKKKGNSQYGKFSGENKTITIREGKAKFLLNLSDYLDTGIFLDHRPLRNWVGKNSQNKDILNLFCYTGSFSVHADLGGCTSTTNVDLSPTYLEWTKRNMFLNSINISRHEFITADASEWILDPKNSGKKKYDTIILDPPTFSNSKKLEGIWDLQRDYSRIITVLLAKFLKEDGVIYFSTNFRKFRMDAELISGRVEDISESTIPFDFRDPKIHRTWKIEKI